MTGEPLNFQRGDHVWLTAEDRTVEAMVILASDNGRSLMLAFDALLHGHLGMMPVSRLDDGKYVTLFGGYALQIEPKVEAKH